MPYTFDPNPQLFRIVLSGDVSMKDLTELLREVNAAESALDVIPARTVDLTATSDVADVSGLMVIVEERRRQVFRNPFKVALVAPRHIDLGRARMFHIMLDNPQVRVEVFRTLSEAERWIREGAD